MPYLLLAGGFMIGSYALYRFFLEADTAQVRMLFINAARIALVLGLFYLAVTGRMIAVIVALPLLWRAFRNFYKKDKPVPEDAKPARSIMTRREALEVLNLEEGADTAQIQDAYKNLMRKVHPDNEGSDWMAAKLNEARDILLKGK